MNMLKSPVMVLIKLVLAAALPAAAGVLLVSVMGREWLSPDLTLAMIVAASYVSAAAYLLAHYPMLILRVRISLFLSVMSVAGIAAAVMVTPAQEKTGLLALMIFAVVASIPLVLFGAHNVIWSLQQLRKQKPAARTLA